LKGVIDLKTFANKTWPHSHYRPNVITARLTCSTLKLLLMSALVLFQLPKLLGADFWVDTSPVCKNQTVIAHYWISEDDAIFYEGMRADFYFDTAYIDSVGLEYDGESGYYADYTYPAPGQPIAVTLGAEETGDDTGDTWAETEVQYRWVNFSKSELRVGVGKSASVAVTMLPAGASQSLTFSTTSSKASASPSSASSTPATVTVTGVTASTANQDTALQVVGACTQNLPITVTVPKTCNESSPATGSGMAQKPNTLTVVFGPANVTITVYDQFGTVLDSSWDGTQMAESINGSSPPTSLTHSLASGVIIDPCIANYPCSDQQFVDDILAGRKRVSVDWNPTPAISQEVSVGSYVLTPKWSRQYKLDLNVLSVRNVSQ
jgi:hypothetical protein